jgi:putative nucleotidyltransferase with HDIG domain
MKDYEVEIKDEVRRNVEADLALMLKEIKNEDLRKGVVEAWALSLTLNGFSAVHDLEGSGLYNVLVLKKGTQEKHLCTVARIALAIGRAFKEENPNNPVDLDVLIAGGLLHDVGKPPQYNTAKLKKWAEAPYLEGDPMVEHSMYGYYICMLVGLPPRVAHIPAVHDENYGVQRSLEATIVHNADGLAWFCPMLLGELDTSYPFSVLKKWPYKKPGEP